MKRSHTIASLFVLLLAGLFSAPAVDASQERYDCDNLDRLIQETTPQGSITYAYDAIGRRTTMAVNGQQPVFYGYDAASRLVQVQQGSLTVGLGYDAAGRRTGLSYSNGTNATYGYDTASRLLNIVHQGPAGVIENLSYAYDAAGNRINLTRANGAATNLPAAVQAAYDAANQQVQFNSGTPNNTFDANGNLTSETTPTGITTYTYDARNRLIARSGPGINESFAYDALGRRISKTINGQTTQFLYDGNDIVAEMQGSAVVATYLRSLNIDEMFGILRQEGAYFSIYDGIGSTLALTDQTGTPVVRYSYDPFGTTQSTNPAFPNPFQFTGRENDGTGLYYYRARYYSPKLQRFLSDDRIGFSGRSLNLYTYASNSPLRYSDPLGLWSTDAHRYFLVRRFGEVSPELFSQIVQGSNSVDSLVGQLPAFAPEHAMTPMLGDKKKAREATCEFIKTHMDLFQRYNTYGGSELAYFHLGQALHPVMDSTSPLHRGFQYWPGPGGSQHFTEEGISAITPDLEAETLGLMSAVVSGDYSAFGCGK